ncbi:ABC transporter ATP-binding protein [Thioclava sp. FTW29]|uniref:ABC transporter ATP-binding protein n=1 Tax=Thioclava litoralis TaxID=3076557 RepID=A0ABZ1E744_9RHOB|nr:ABC transporter ATP-binding protein [Thioclava sp. FTW29]
MSLYTVESLRLAYPARRLFAGHAVQQVLRDLSFTIAAGETVGLVGASGSGKSSLLRCLLALEPRAQGCIRFQGRRLRAGSVRALGWYRRAVQYVPQDPVASLEPRMSVAQIVMEPLRRLTGETAPLARATEALESVGLDHRYLARRPHELSGGQAQRVAIARAIVLRPQVLLADEPVSGLDMTIRAQVAALLRGLCAEQGMGLVMVSHDLSVVATLCRRVMVMEAGALVEDRPLAALLAAPHHPQTRRLLNAAPPMIAAASSQGFSNETAEQSPDRGAGTCPSRAARAGGGPAHPYCASATAALGAEPPVG